MSNFQSAMIDIISVMIVLGIMIFVHEWGHFIAAKLFGVRVDVFSFGLGPRICGVKRGDTDYRLSALPFGGYVRMAGDNPVEERSGAPYEFLARPRWQRVLIAVAGPFMNVLLAFIIFWGIFWRVGIPSPEYLRQVPEVAAVPQSPVVVSGILPGDRILEVNGTKTPTWGKVLAATSKVKPGDSLSIEILRGGSPMTLSVRVPEKPSVFDLVGFPAMPAVADDVEVGFPAEKAGMKSDDQVIAMNGKPIVTWPQLVEGVRQSNGSEIHFVVRRDGKDIPLDITPAKGVGVDGQPVWQVGVAPRTTDDFERQGFIESAKDAGGATIAGMRQILDVVAGLFTGKVSMRELQGVVGIARVSGQAAKRGAMPLMEITAIISLNLGLLNLFPIPILDGGHVLLLTVEGVLRRDLSIALKERFVQVGLVFLLGIFAFAMYSDILKLIQSH